LMAHLRTTGQMRQPKGGTTKGGLGHIVDAASIRERPAEADDRAVPGHWEGDLLSGANNAHIATLVERRTRFVMPLKVPSKDTATVVAALGKHVRNCPKSCAAPWPGIEARRWLTTRTSPSPPTCRSISAIHAVLGSAAATRTPTACCDSISRGERISRSRCGSINARGRPWASKPLPIDYEQCCSDQLNPHLKTVVERTSVHGSKVPKAAVSRCSNTSVQKPDLLDHLVGAQQKRLRDGQPVHSILVARGRDSARCARGGPQHAGVARQDLRDKSAHAAAHRVFLETRLQSGSKTRSLKLRRYHKGHLS